MYYHIYQPFSSVDGLTVDLKEDVSVVEPEATYLLLQMLPPLDPSRPKSMEFHPPGFMKLYGFIDVVQLAFLELFPQDLQVVVEGSFVLNAEQHGSGEAEALQGQVIITVSVLGGDEMDGNGLI